MTFQQHIADYLLRRARLSGQLEQTDITDTEHCLAEDHLWAFLTATQAEQLSRN
jgi:type I restriction enzyme R subunit